MSLRVNKFIFLRRKQKAERGLLFTKKKKKRKNEKRKREELWNNFSVWRKGVINCYWLLQNEIIFHRKEKLWSFSMFHAEPKDDKKSDYVSHTSDLLFKVTWTVGVRSYDHSLLNFKVASDDYVYQSLYFCKRIKSQ